ncbi:methylated-DNA--[protein]-cysteine S-methyltransferase [Paenibacillus flagellatus]|uniref:Methylated-DNA--protein-cysteine methyltransferase n=1 Tax=Paenibacillus flagellatus TaxID=2211139 RepID=A0A2V5K5L6_9BACL|nr:methylated-DNA--[protein]-cysteine S-methyltransferase [Paenibacillus flagellatus]PYI52983.1 cysteine methyltransferase [Paenibacillus flagellatus]
MNAPEAPNRLYWCELSLEDRRMIIAATERGLCFVSLMAEPYEELLAWAGRRLPGVVPAEDPAVMAEYARQIAEYFAEERTAFTVPIDYIGTPFQQSVWKAVAAIPYGEVRSYADIAAAAGSPRAVRAVGAANGANPIPIVVPCHRVIGTNGTLTGYRGGMKLKEKLLTLEGFAGYKAVGHERFRF